MVTVERLDELVSGVTEVEVADTVVEGVLHWEYQSF